MLKKGQGASAAATLIALIAGFMLLYLFFLSPEMRDELLYGTSYGSDPGTEQPVRLLNKTVFSEVPGRIDFLRFKEYEHSLPSVNLYTTKSSEEVNIGDSLYIKNGMFDRLDKNISFTVSNIENTDKYTLSIRAARARGRLSVNLNGNTIFDGVLSPGMSIPISISGGQIQQTNRLSFSVSDVGWQFWTTNEYEIDEIKLFFDLTDTSQQKARNVFNVDEVEKFNIQSASLRFYPDCSPSEAGGLTIEINGNQIMSSIPDCGQPNMVEFSPSLIQAGDNRVIFSAKKGRYFIDQIIVKTRMKPMVYPVYYFDLPKTIFTTQTLDKYSEDCGDVDGVCPSNCDKDIDMDCCFLTSNYWCDVQPSDQDRRCSAVTDIDQCHYCPSGYEARTGRPPSLCEDQCGDDTDNYCPAGCSKYLDKDCCFKESEDNFWCDNIPKGGLNQCKSSLIPEECDLCYGGWESEGSDFKCPASIRSTEDVLKSRYRIKLSFKFLDDGERKAAKVYINGYQFYMDTTGEDYSRYIDAYVESGTNAVKIEPDQTILDIRKMIVDIEE
jgi:hypothetical protein